MDRIQSRVIVKSTPLINERKWYVAYTAPRAEKQVAQRLQILGIEYYLPFRIEFRQWSDRVKKQMVTAFPSYIFVKINSAEYYSALNTLGVVRYVQFGGKPAIIREETLNSIKKILEFNTDHEMGERLPKLGSNYRIPSGPLKDLEGKIIRHKGKTHFVLEIKELGKYISLPLSSIED